MLRKTDFIKEFKNGNLNIKLNRDAIEEMKRDEILFISEALSWLDCYFIGETYCLSNYECGHTIYNLFSDLVYIFPWSYLEDLKKGKSVKLYAHKPDATDRELIKKGGL